MHRLVTLFDRGSSRSSGEERQATFAPKWAGPTFLLLALALLPWIVYLYFSLPSRTETDHYRVAWVGFDIALVLLLARTAVLAIKGKRQMELPAVATASLLLVDAWFDVITSKGGAPRIEAIALAVFVELPTAALALYLSRRVELVIDSHLQHTGVDPETAKGVPAQASDDPLRQESA